MLKQGINLGWQLITPESCFKQFCYIETLWMIAKNIEICMSKNIFLFDRITISTSIDRKPQYCFWKFISIMQKKKN